MRSLRPEVLIACTDPLTARRLERLVREACGGSAMVSVRFVGRLPREDLSSFLAILLHDSLPDQDRSLVGADRELARRALVMADLTAPIHVALWHQLGTEAVPVVPFGAPEDDERATAVIASILYGVPALSHLEPVFEAVCDPAQRVVIREFVIRAEARTPRGLAKALFRSRRSLARDCTAMGLRSPQELLRLGRVSRGLTWGHRHGGGLRRAAVAAGYADVESFRRAVRDAFGISPLVVLADWGDQTALEGRYRAAIKRA